MSYLRGMKYLTQKQEKGKYERLEHKGQNVLYTNEALVPVFPLKVCKTSDEPTD